MPNDRIDLINEHRFFFHMKPEFINIMAGCSTVTTYQTQEMLAKEGNNSNHFFAILDGRVSIETYLPGMEPVVFQTVHQGDIVGWSWLFPPYEWVFDARALTSVKTLAFDTRCLREKCEHDTALGFELMKRLSQVMTLRLKATRLQLLDMYGKKTPSLLQSAHINEPQA